jgi:DNA repair protein SbcD/Mre11
VGRHARDAHWGRPVVTRIAFTADLHVDAYGSRIDPATGLNARLVDYLATVGWVAEEADRRGALGLVVAGDFTERRHPAPWMVSRIRSALAGGPSRQIYLRGNHDGEIAGGSIVSLLDDGFGHESGDEDTRCGVSRPRLEFVTYDVVLACIPYLDRHWLRSQPGFETVPDADLFRILAEQFLAIAAGLYAEARRDYPDAACVLVCHQTLAGAAMSDTQRAFLGDLSLVVDARALQAIGFEAVVAGHLHRHQAVIPGDRPVLYTGSVERVDFGEALETKGFIVADVEPGRFDWTFVETPARRFVTWDLSLSDIAAPAPAGLDGAIVRILNVDPGSDVAEIRRLTEQAGAFEVQEIRVRRPESTAPAGGLAETLSTQEALVAYVADSPDREVLETRGREILAAVAA